MHFLKNLQKQQLQQQARPPMSTNDLSGMPLQQQGQQPSPSMAVSPNGPSSGK